MLKRLAWIVAALLLLPTATQAQQTVVQPNLDLAPNEVLNRNVRVLRTTNKAQLNRYVPRVYSFRNVNPFAVLRFVRQVVRAEEGAIFTFVSPDGNGGRMLVAVPEYQLDYIDNIVRTVDRPGQTSGDGTRRIYRQLKHRRANISSNPLLDDSDFINTFSIYLTLNDSLIIVDPEQNAVFFEDAPSGADYLDIAITDKLDVPTPQAILTTSVYELDLKNNARIGLDYIAWKNGPGARLFAIGGFREAGRLDLRNGNPALLTDQYGINNIPGELTRNELQGTFRNRGYNFAYTYEVSSAFFDYLAVRGKARVLTEATVAALNTRSALITAGDQILFYEVNSTDPSGIRQQGTADGLYSVNDDTRTVTPVVGSSSNGETPVPGNVIPVTSPDPDLVLNDIKDDGFLNNSFLTAPSRFIQADFPQTEALVLDSVQAGLKIALTPLIYDNGLDVTIDGHIAEYTGFDDQGSPIINSRQFGQSVRLGEGQEIVLGGLMRETSVKTAPKIPVLGSLPVIGYLFGGEATNREQSEVVVALTAEEIVRSYTSEDYGITEEHEAVINKAEGTESIEIPSSNWGFDQLFLDRDKTPYEFGEKLHLD